MAAYVIACCQLTSYIIQKDLLGVTVERANKHPGVTFCEKGSGARAHAASYENATAWFSQPGRKKPGLMSWRWHDLLPHEWW
jgi:hypothetical protein